jgi:hypothetical protein
MTKNKSLVLWIISIIIMVIIVFYQRMTGPTYPVHGEVTINNQTYRFEMPRTHGGSGGQIISLIIPDKSISGKIKFRRFHSYDNWSYTDMQRSGDTLMYELPHLLPAGKIRYQVFLQSGINQPIPVTQEAVIVRYKDSVPTIVIILHLFFLFTAITLSTRAGLEALFKGEKTFALAVFTTIFMFIGGIIIGPMMQQYAFGALWTGWPLGHDLTDNKTAAAVIIWIIAMWRTWKNRTSRGWVIAASIVLLIVFLIPHSILGSEIDYTKLPK